MLKKGWKISKSEIDLVAWRLCHRLQDRIRKKGECSGSGNNLKKPDKKQWNNKFCFHSSGKLVLILVSYIVSFNIISKFHVNGQVTRRTNLGLFKVLNDVVGPLHFLVQNACNYITSIYESNYGDCPHGWTVSQQKIWGLVEHQYILGAWWLTRSFHENHREVTWKEGKSHISFFLLPRNL